MFCLKVGYMVSFRGTGHFEPLLTSGNKTLSKRQSETLRFVKPQAFIKTIATLVHSPCIIKVFRLLLKG